MLKCLAEASQKDKLTNYVWFCYLFTSHLEEKFRKIFIIIFSTVLWIC